MKVGFFLEHYPVFSETFVTDELLALQKHFAGEIWFENSPDKDRQPAVKKIKFPTHRTPLKIIGKNFFRFLKAHGYWLADHPGRYFAALSLIVRFFSLENLKIFFRAPLVAIQVKEANCNLLYVHEADRAFCYALVCKILCQVPLGIIFHTYYLFYKNKFLQQKIRLAEFVVFQSEFSLDYAQRKTGLKNLDHCHVISSPGVNLDFFESEPRKKQSGLRLLSIGRLEEAKGYELLVQAMPTIKRAVPKVTLTIVGYGSLEKKLQKQIKKLGLEKNVSLAGKIGHTPQLLQLMKQSDIFILPSVIDQTNVRDVQPNALKEAMAMGLLTITARLKGIEEVISDGKNGFLLKTVTPEKIAEQVLAVYALSQQKKQSISQEAQKTIQESFGREKTIAELAILFKKYAKKT